MASIINALRNISSDSWWFPKIIFFSFFSYVIVDKLEQIKNQDPNFLLMGAIIFMLFMGCASILMNRNINNKSPILPSLFNILEIIKKAICSTLIIIPGILSLIVAVSFVQKYITIEDAFVMTLIYSLVIVFFMPFIVIPVILYSVNGKILDALRFRLIIEGSGNFCVQFLAYIIQYFFTLFLVFFLIYMLFHEMLGQTQVEEIIFSILISFTFFSFFSYCSDLYGDALPEIPPPGEKKEKKATKPVKKH